MDDVRNINELIEHVVSKIHIAEKGYDISMYSLLGFADKDKIEKTKIAVKGLDKGLSIHKISPCLKTYYDSDSKEDVSLRLEQFDEILQGYLNGLSRRQIDELIESNDPIYKVSPEQIRKKDLS